MIRIFALFLSYLFNPVIFVLSIPYFLIYRQTTSVSYAFKWEIFSAIFILLGIILVVFEKHKGIFSDYDLSKREERWKFYAIIMIPVILYFIASLFLKGLFFSMSIISIGTILGLLMFVIANKFLKPSIHTGVASAYVVSVALLYGPIAFFITFWMVPVIIWARLTLKKHTKNEVLVGGIIGTLITLLTFFVGSYIHRL
ncbi:MAG: hypothetical protein Q8P80_03225 [Candidatus Levybacteria bacterium]|nr:hypothetical protein [Candidatus Levybacteria bacterium]